ncbi:MAG: sensor histidine kinase, partial [Paracoccus sp. (in: a-proteobacteria)]|nr:sensor histidine kinase [Paracoccus sp. (in: a-proteobacteria)]
MLGWHSIRGRLLWLSALWLSGALIVAYLLIGHVLERFVTGRFDAELGAVADALMVGTGADAEGLAELLDTPADPRFSRPLSGWYWQITADGAVIATSASLYEDALPATGRGPDGAGLRALGRSYTVPGSNEALSLAVTAPQAEIDAALASVRRPLAVTLAVLGLGLGLAVLVQVTAGLASLGRMGEALRRVRAGQANALPRARVSELGPLVDEMNVLLAQNRAQLSRSREQIGNLAHSLKTPLM